MLSRWKKQWRALRESRAGERFQDHYREANRREGGQPLIGRIVRIGAAVVCGAVGVVFVFIPGPAVVFFAIAGTLMATESLWVAKLLDWLELKIRALARVLSNWWRRLSLAGKIVAGVLLTSGATAAAYGAYRVVAG